MADADLPCVENNMNETIPLLPGTDDEDDRTTISSHSSLSTSTSLAQAAKLKRILSEKKLELLRRAKARKMKEELLRLDNEIAAAEDAVELAKIKDRFYGEQLGGAPAVDVANLQDFEGNESPKQSDLKVINTESTTQVVKEQNVADPKPIGVNDEQFMLWKSARNDASVVKVPLSASTPNQPVMSVLNRKESSLNPAAIPYVPEVQVHEECPRGQAGEPYAVRIVLGWAVLGPVDASGSLNSQTVNVNFVKYGSELSDQQMEQFLRLEDIDMNKSSKKGMSVEGQESLNKMTNSVRLVNGHYEVGMLWKSEDPWLPDNRKMAEARSQSLKRKLKRDENFHRKYRDFMDNLVSKGYARKLTVEEAVHRSRKKWYLPHHGIFHPQKKDKIRVVFDAAALHDGVSLNNQLHQGPDLTNSLLGVLLRFRQEPIALVADIEGMFNQVKVPPEDADALRFLWWEDSNLEQPSEFQMTSHIFGATDSPSCASFCLRKAAEDNKREV